jgi:hypothetical protein
VDIIGLGYTYDFYYSHKLRKLIIRVDGVSLSGDKPFINVSSVIIEDLYNEEYLLFNIDSDNKTCMLKYIKYSGKTIKITSSGVNPLTIISFSINENIRILTINKRRKLLVIA